MLLLCRGNKNDFIIFLFSAFIGQAIAKIRKDKARGIMIIPYWKTQYWFPVIMDLLTDLSIILPVSLIFDRIKIHPLYPKLALLAVYLSGNKSECRNFRNRLLTSSLIHKYESILNRSAAYCTKRKNNPLSTTVNEILLFLTELYNNVCHYSGLCNACSALATSVQLIGGPNVSNHPLICCFIKGIYNRHPPMPRYAKIWDINKVLNYIDSLPVNEELSYKQLTN